MPAPLPPAIHVPVMHLSVVLAVAVVLQIPVMEIRMTIREGFLLSVWGTQIIPVLGGAIPTALIAAVIVLPVVREQPIVTKVLIVETGHRALVPGTPLIQGPIVTQTTQDRAVVIRIEEQLVALLIHPDVAPPVPLNANITMDTFGMVLTGSCK